VYNGDESPRYHVVCGCGFTREDGRTLEHRPSRRCDERTVEQAAADLAETYAAEDRVCDCEDGE
jgi:hypothetical protein